MTEEATNQAQETPVVPNMTPAPEQKTPASQESEPLQPKLYANKYKTDFDLENAYINLEKKMGALYGAPEKYDLEGFNGDRESLLLTELQNWGKEIGINQDGFNKLLGKMAHATNTDSQVRAERELAALGPDGKSLIDRVQTWAHNTLDENEAELISNMASTAEEYKLLDKLRAHFKLPGRPQTSSVSNIRYETMADIDTEVTKNYERFRNNEKGYRTSVLMRKADIVERNGDHKKAASLRFLAGAKK